MTIGKAGAESLLTFGSVNRLQDTSILEKLKIMAIFSLVFILTSLAVIFTFSPGLGASVALPVLFFLPQLSLLTLKCCGLLTDLSCGQVVEGAASACGGTRAGRAAGIYSWQWPLSVSWPTRSCWPWSSLGWTLAGPACSQPSFRTHSSSASARAGFLSLSSSSRSSA